MGIRGSVLAAGTESTLHSKESNFNPLAADLLTAASEGRVDEVTKILETDMNLLRVGDFNGDTALHLLVSDRRYVEPLLELLRFMLGKNPKLLKEVAKQGNGHQDTPLHLAIKNKHHELIVNLLGKLEPGSFRILNEDSKSPEDLARELRGPDFHNSLSEVVASFEDHQDEIQRNEMLLDEISETLEKLKNGELSLGDVNQDALDQVCMDPFMISSRAGHIILHSAVSDIEISIEFGKIICEYAASKANKLTKIFKRLVRMMESGDRSILQNLQLEANKYGELGESLCLLAVNPEEAYKMDEKGESPLYVAIKNGHVEDVKYVLGAIPERKMSLATITSLLNSNRSSLPHAAIRKRNLNMLIMILMSIPRLINSSDEKGWKPLSYAAYKGFLDEVNYLLDNFPKSVENCDSDGSYPIHKAISGGHISVINAFIKSHPKTLHYIDHKKRSVLHIAVLCRKVEVLRYLKDVTGVEELYYLRDNNNKTYEDYAPRRRDYVSLF